MMMISVVLLSFVLSFSHQWGAVMSQEETLRLFTLGDSTDRLVHLTL